MAWISILPVNVFAAVSGPDVDGVQGVLQSGDKETFAKYAPISTVTIDFSKTTKIELDQANPRPNGNPNGYYLDNGYVKADGVKMKESFTSLSSFTLIYKNAATLSTGETKDVEVIFGSVQDSQVIGKTGNGSYTDNLTFVNAESIVHNGPAIAPLSGVKKHFGFRTNVKVRIGKNGDFLNDTFFFTTFDVNINRGGNSNFEKLVYAYANYNYSEAVEPSSGLNSESDIYIPDSYAESWDYGNSASPNPTYDVRFIGLNGNLPISQKNYNSGFAAVGNSNGFVARYWSSSGTNTSPIELYIMPDRITHTSKSASGDNGRIELWTSGKIDDDNATHLEGGTIAAPRMYDIPNAKEVTYKMTPDIGYELDVLMINGTEATAAEVLDADGNTLYYTYTFDETVIEDQEIMVTWKKIVVPPIPTPTPEPQPEPFTPPTPDTGMNTNFDDGSMDMSIILAICQIVGIIMAFSVLFVRKYSTKK